MILGLLEMVAANAAVLLVSHAALRKIRTGDTEVDVLLFLLLRFLFISAAVAAAGLTGTLRAGPFGAAGFALLGLLLGLGEHRRLPPLRLPAMPRFLAVVAGIVALRLALQVWFFAPLGLDAVSYHLPKISEWMRAGAFVHAPGTDVRETFPAGFELIETWWVVFLHHDVLIELAGVEFLALGIAAVFALARSLGLRPESAALAALLYLLTPGVYLLGLSCMNDVPVAALIVATAALVHRRVHPVLLLLPIGLGLGMKPTFAYALPGLLVLALLLPRAPLRRPESVRPALILAGIAVLLGAFWYVRNAAMFGSPIYPAGRSPMIASLPPPSETLRWLGVRLLKLADSDLCDRQGAITTLLAQVPGWGVAVIAIGLPALLDRLREEPAFRPLAWAFLVSLTCVYLLTPPPFFVYRFLLFVPALFAIAIASFSELHPAFSHAARLGIVLLLVATTMPDDARSRCRDLVAQDWRERTFDSNFRAVPRDEKVACLYGFNSRVYEAAAPDFRRPLAGIRDASSAEDLRDQLRQIGARWLWSLGDPESKRLPAIVRQAEQAGYLRKQGPSLYRCVTP